jgi:hypothetical protein
LKSLTEQQIVSFLGVLLSTFATHTNTECRSVYYDILVQLYENAALRKREPLLTVKLLSGLTDDSELINKKIFAFWDAQLPDTALARLLENLR